MEAGFSSNDRSKSNWRRRRRGRNESKATKDLQEAAQGRWEKPWNHWTRKSFPNLFFAVQVTNPDIHKTVRHFQETIISRNSDYRHCMVPIAKSHVTLHVFHAPDESIPAILAAMERAARPLETTPIHLDFDGVDNFNNRVVFGGLRPNQRLTQLWRNLSIELNQLKVTEAPLQDETFRPHLTILKTSGIKDKNLRHLNISPSDYEDMIELNFGQEAVRGVQLLSMVKPPDPNGYYYSHGEIAFANVRENNRDGHEVCCIVPVPQTSQEKRDPHGPRSEEMGADESVSQTSIIAKLSHL